HCYSCLSSFYLSTLGFFFSSRRRHTRSYGDWSSDVCSSDLCEDFPSYVETGGETARGLHAIRVLQDKKDFTVDSLIAAAYDSYLMWFEKPIPCLVKAWDDAPAEDPLKTKLAEPMEALRKWDLRWGVNSVPTSLAVFWGEDIQQRVGGDARSGGLYLSDYICTKAPAKLLLESLS